MPIANFMIFNQNRRSWDCQNRLSLIFSYISLLYVMEWGTSLPKTWPTFQMKVLTCMGMQILGRSRAHIAILWISLLLETESTPGDLLPNPDYHHSRFYHQNKIDKYLQWGFGLVQEVSVKLKVNSLANISSFLQTTLSGLKKVSLLASITFWLRTDALGPAFSRNKTAYFVCDWLQSMSVNNI